jgi:hypothetical protein
MRDRRRQKHAARAVIEQALSKALAQLALAQSTASLCGDALVDELEDLVDRATELRKNIAQAERIDAPTNRCDDDAKHS